ncbi:hypothetical protein PFICI_03990 [Pestalotiopsis fici W106-1]|uniref:Uncharacterized protein n=1 Tax=Pestalotiopsis fici (strain W106-1 / CGMCC3.15140) TaxID=1229662 RepID=W3XIW7_PESFW|nr:uncharacterized protein PFICI_03990 [Pestalotiopsis fici W106-1]ETS85965.1 hypothetical protein PFICI_03990 [Pestalotiopsis fici W106-1]
MKGLGDVFGSSRELVRKLKAIDKRYNIWVDSVYVQEERRKDQMKGDILSDHYDLWLAKHTTDMAGLIPPETKLTAVFRNLTRIITTNQSYDAHLYRVAVQELENLKLENVVAIWINQTNALRPGSTVLSANSEVLESNVHETVQSHSSSQIRPSSPSSWTPGWFAKKRQSTFSSDTTFKSDSDKASIGSAPNIPILQMEDPVLRQIINMGKSFIKRGELDNAEIAFQRASAILHPRSRMYDMRVSSPEVDAQLACIALYRGKYAEAHRKFEALLDCPIPQEQLKNEYNAEICRWIGVALLHQGKYESAIVQFQQLLLQSPRYSSDEEVQIRRDLALASAYSGNFDEAFGQLKMANECLQILEERQALEQKNSMENTTTGRETTSTQAVHPTVTPRPTKSNDKEDTSSVDMPLRTPKTSELKAKKDGLLFTQAKIALA